MALSLHVELLLTRLQIGELTRTTVSDDMNPVAQKLFSGMLCNTRVLLQYRVFFVFTLHTLCIYATGLCKTRVSFAKTLTSLFHFNTITIITNMYQLEFPNQRLYVS